MSQDPVLCQEIWDGVDIHGRNQETLKLPERVIAKIFVFRLIYGGSEWSYARDPAFNWISDSPKYWRKVIDEFYAKYQGLYRWHERIVEEVQRTSIFTSPTGRQYHYEPYRDNYGNWRWPRTQILNYPVQGLGADLMSIARISAYRRLRELRLRELAIFVNTVHDSILLDTHPKVWYDVCITLEDVFVGIPRNFERIFNKPFNLPMKGEVKYGNNWKDLQKFKREVLQ